MNRIILVTPLLMFALLFAGCGTTDDTIQDTTKESLGVFEPTMPGFCQISAPFSCMDVVGRDVATGDTFILKMGIEASGISTATVTGIQVNGQDCTLTSPLDGNILNAKNSPINVICSPTLSFDKGDKYLGTVTITYTTLRDGLSRTTTGQFSGIID